MISAEYFNAETVSRYQRWSEEPERREEDMTSLYRILSSTVIITLLYLLADSFVVFVANPIQGIWFPNVTEYASLVFLPAAVRLFSTSLLGSEAIPGLFLGMLISSHYLWGVNDIQLLLILSVIGGLVSWVTMRALVPFGLDAFYLTPSSVMPSLRTYLLASVMVALADAFLLCAVLETNQQIVQIMLHFAAFAIGDVIGVIAGWVIIKYGMLVFRYLKGSRADQHSDDSHRAVLK